MFFGVYLQHKHGNNFFCFVFCVSCFFVCHDTTWNIICFSAIYKIKKFKSNPTAITVCVRFLSHPETCGRFLAVQKDLRVP